MMIRSLLEVSIPMTALRAQMPTPAGSFAQLANSIITSLFRFVIETDSRPSSNCSRSLGNSTRHGLLSQRLPLIYGKTKQFTHLLKSLEQDLEPVGTSEEMLVEKIAQTYWRLASQRGTKGTR